MSRFENNWKGLRYRTLRALELRDAPLMLDWMLDSQTQSVFARDFSHMDVAECKKFVKASWHDLSSLHFAAAPDDEYLGTVSLKGIDFKNLSAEYAIALRPCARGTGVARVATYDVLDFARIELGLHRVWLSVRTDNLRARNLYKRCGFSFEGVARDALRDGDRYADLAYYSVVFGDSRDSS